MATNTSKTVVLVTGGNRGIGLGIIEALLKQPPSSSHTDGGPYHILLAARNLEKGKAAASCLKPDHGNELSVLQLDITSAESIAAAVSSVEKLTGRIDILINNAGALPREPDPVQVLRETLEIDLVAPFAVSKAFEALLLAQSGDTAKSKRVINLTSLLGSTTVRYDVESRIYPAQVVEYRMAKAGLNMMTACQNQELGPKGVKAFAFCPGYTATEFSSSPDVVRQVPWSHEVDVPAAESVKIVDGRRDGDLGKLLSCHGETDEW